MFSHSNESQPKEHLSVPETIFISKVDFEFLAGINEIQGAVLESLNSWFYRSGAHIANKRFLRT